MRELIDTIDQWRAQGQQVALATVVSAEGSTPRPIGAKMAMTRDGQLAGSVSGGCIEADVYEHAMEVLETGIPRWSAMALPKTWPLRSGWRVAAPTCVHRRAGRLIMGTYERIADCIRSQKAVSAITVLQGGPAPGARMLAFADGEPEGSLGLGALEQVILSDAHTALRAARSETRNYPYTDQHGAESQVLVFLESIVPPPVLLVIGAGHTSIPLTAIARICGFKVVLIDARAAFASADRFKDVDEILVEWPHEAVARMSLTENTYVAVLTHDAKFEEPLLPLLLRSPARYIGVIGSRKTQLLRRERLRGEGFTDDDIRRLSGPIGMDIGAVKPEEIALSIMAEMVARQHGRPGGFLTDRLAAEK